MSDTGKKTMMLSKKGESQAGLPVITKARQSRIRQVQEMKLSGFRPGEIATKLGISRRQVDRDLKDGKILSRLMAQEFDQDSFLGDSIKFWLQIRWKSMRDSEMCQEENARIGHRRNAMTAQEKLVKELQDCGLLAKVPERLLLGPDLPFEDPEVRQAYLDFLILARERGEKNLDL
jgi:hypothetical protein